MSDADDNTLSPLTEAEQNYVNTKVNNILDNQDERVNRMLDKQDRDVIRIMDSIDEAQGATGKHPNAATESVGGKAESGTPIDGKTTNTGNKTGNGGVVISNYSMEYESGSNTGAGEYAAPSGGGGVTSTIKANGQTVNFGHGGRHLEGTGLNVDAVNQALANEVSTLNLGTGQFHKGQIIVDGITIEYTSYGVSEGIINVGTYYPL